MRSAGEVSSSWCEVNVPRPLRHLRSLRWRTLVGGAFAIAVAAGGAALAAGTDGISDAMAALAPAQPLMPPVRSCSSTIVIGDSLTAIRAQATPHAFAVVGLPVTVDAAVSRRVPEEVPEPWSGVRAVRRLLAAGIDAPCWVVALGSNDLFWIEHEGGYGATRVGTANNYIDWMLDEIRVDGSRHVWWVNVNHRASNRIAATAIFNDVLDQRAVIDSDFDVIDWYTLSASNIQWFQDTVHVNAAGYGARAALMASVIAAAYEPSAG